MKLFFLLFLLIQFLFQIPAFGENQTTVDEIKQELQTLQSLINSHTENHTVLIEIQQELQTLQSLINTNNENQEALIQIQQEIKTLTSTINSHNENSALYNNSAIWIGGGVGLMGLTVTIVQVIKETKRQKKEKKKIEKAENKIKWTLGDILDYLESLNTNPPEKEKLKDILAWKRIIQFVKLLRIASTPIAKDLKDDLGDHLLGFIVNMEKHFERAINNEEISFGSLISSMSLSSQP